MKHVLYTVSTGLLTGAQLETEDETLLAINTPAGCAWIAGDGHPDTNAVQFIDGTPTLVEQLNPAPPSNAVQTWERDPATQIWRPVPTLAALKAHAIEPVTEILTSLDAELVRPTTELLAAQLAGSAIDSFAQAKFAALMTRKTALRARIAAINACASPADLDALAATPMP